MDLDVGFSFRLCLVIQSWTNADLELGNGKSGSRYREVDKTCPSFILLDILDFALEKVERSRLTGLFEFWCKIGDGRLDRSVHASLRGGHGDRLTEYDSQTVTD